MRSLGNDIFVFFLENSKKYSIAQIANHREYPTVKDVEAIIKSQSTEL